MDAVRPQRCLLLRYVVTVARVIHHVGKRHQRVAILLREGAGQGVGGRYEQGGGGGEEEGGKRGGGGGEEEGEEGGMRGEGELPAQLDMLQRKVAQTRMARQRQRYLAQRSIEVHGAR